MLQRKGITLSSLEFLTMMNYLRLLKKQKKLGPLTKDIGAPNFTILTLVLGKGEFNKVSILFQKQLTSTNHVVSNPLLSKN